MPGRPVTWRDFFLLAGIIAAIALWAWGTGFWMGTYFVSRTSFDALSERVTVIERKTR